MLKINDGNYKVLKIGSFCCAGWYNMDLEKVVKEINKLCITEYNDYYNLPAYLKLIRKKKKRQIFVVLQIKNFLNI